MFRFSRILAEIQTHSCKLTEFLTFQVNSAILNISRKHDVTQPKFEKNSAEKYNHENLQDGPIKKVSHRQFKKNRITDCQ